jgi:hypothetical protein
LVRQNKIDLAPIQGNLRHCDLHFVADLKNSATMLPDQAVQILFEYIEVVSNA